MSVLNEKSFQKKVYLLLFLFFPFIIFLLSFFLLNSCTKKAKNSSVLILALESLDFESISCEKTRKKSSQLKAFYTLCDEAIWFTHAFTPSTMSQAALASLLTGKYPHEHRVWDNGKSFLSEEHTTISEKALQLGYRTSFFSGGSPLWRKSGLSQGFEIFNDYIKINFNDFYRSFYENFNLFLKWLDHFSNHQAFFSVIYSPDLQFPNTTTFTNLGEIRNLSHESQIEELGESLQFLFSQLKKRNQWNNTHIILVGLNGRDTKNRLNELSPYNLHTENTQVTLFIKPAKKKTNKFKGWKIDHNVSLVDVGATLYDLLNQNLPSPLSRRKNLQVISLKRALYTPGGGKETLDPHRLILIESAWPRWKGFARSRFAVRRGHYLFLFDNPITIYNTLIDRLESIPMSKTDPLWASLYNNIKNFMEEMGFLPWVRLEPSLIDKLEVGRNLWGGEKWPFESTLRRLEHLTKVRPFDLQIQGWKAYQALKKRDWKWLKEIGKAHENIFWIFLAESYLEKKSKKSQGRKWIKESLESQRRRKGFINLLQKNTYKKYKKLNFSCEKYFFINHNLESSKLSSSLLLRECEDTLFVLLLKWIYEKNVRKKNLNKEAFIREYIKHKVDQKLFQLNQSKLLIWDTQINFSFHPSITDLYLSLPQSKNLLKQVEFRLKTSHSISPIPFF